MTSCSKCGTTLSPGTRFCTACGQRAEVPEAFAPAAWTAQPAHQPQPAHETQPAHQTQPQARPAPAAPAASGLYSPQPMATAPTSPVLASDFVLGVRLAPGEVLKRVFPIASVRKGFGSIEAQLAVTDSRLLYRAKAKSGLSESTNFREVQIADVSGMAMVSRRGLTPLSLLTLIFGFVLGWIGITMVGGVISAMTFSYGTPGWTPLLFLVLIAVTVAIGMVRYRSTEVALVVYARGIEASPIALSGSVGRQQGGFLALGTAMVGGPMFGLLRGLGFFDASDASDSVEPASAEALYDELGQLILDLQSRGVMGGE